MKIKKGDQVIILRGKDKNKIGKVLKVLPKLNKLIVEKVNIVVKHIKPRKEGQKGERILIAKPFPASKAKLICHKCKKPTRVGYKIINKKKFRKCKKCNKSFE